MKLGHKNLAEGSFFKEAYMTNQPLKINILNNKPSSSSTVENTSTNSVSLPRKSDRLLLSYTFSGKKAVRIACNEEKCKKGWEVELRTISIKELKETVYKAEKVNWICKNSYI